MDVARSLGIADERHRGKRRKDFQSHRLHAALPAYRPPAQGRIGIGEHRYQRLLGGRDDTHRRRDRRRQGSAVKSKGGSTMSTPAPWAPTQGAPATQPDATKTNGPTQPGQVPSDAPQELIDENDPRLISESLDANLEA